MEWGFISLQKLSFLDFFKRRIFVFCPNFPAWRRATLRLFLREEDFSLDFDLTWRFLFKTFLITTALSCQHPRNIVVLCCIWVQTTPVSVTVSWVGGSIDGKHWLCCDTTTAGDRPAIPYSPGAEPSWRGTRCWRAARTAGAEQQTGSHRRRAACSPVLTVCP